MARMNAMWDNNPYSSPRDVDKAWYDHRLFWRIVKCLGVLLLGFVIIDAIIMLRYCKELSRVPPKDQNEAAVAAVRDAIGLPSE